MKKRYVIIIAVLLVYFLLLYLLIGKPYIRKNKLQTTLIVGEDTVWQLINKNWYYKDPSGDIEAINWEEYEVYSNQQYLGKYDLWHNDKWYLFDNKKNSYNYDGSLLAYSSNYNIKVSQFSISTPTDYTYIRKVLNDNSYSINSELTVNSVINIDYDNDGIEEQFYLLSNAFPIDTEPDYIFSIVFMVKENKIYELYNQKNINTAFNGCKPYIYSFIDIDEDNVSEVILSCGRYSEQKQLDMLYKFDNKEFNILISNQ